MPARLCDDPIAAAHTYSTTLGFDDDLCKSPSLGLHVVDEKPSHSGCEEGRSATTRPIRSHGAGSPSNAVM